MRFIFNPWFNSIFGAKYETEPEHKPVEIEIMKKISACIVAREDKTVAKHQFHPYLCSCWNKVKFVLSLWDFQFQYLGRLIFK